MHPEYMNVNKLLPENQIKVKKIKRNKKNQVKK
jgi:hypothetical protein